MAKSLNILYPLLLCVAGMAHADSDPTRPPPDFMPRDEHTSRAANRTAAQSATPPVEQAPLRLQSVIVSPGRQRAQISGQSLALGERIGDAQLIRLTETQAVLQRPSGLLVLELTPGIHKTAPGARLQAPASAPSKTGTSHPPSGDKQ